MTDAIAFYPSPPEQATTLSSEQIRGFNADGFVRPLDALTPDQVDSARAYFELLLSQMQAMRDGRNTYALDGYQLRCRGIWEMALHPKILDYVEDLLGPDFVCWSTHYFCKMGGDKKRVPWHQDATYWPVRPTKTVTVWLAIDDVDAGNSPLRFVPGSHRLGAVEWRKAEGDIVPPPGSPGRGAFWPARGQCPEGGTGIDSHEYAHPRLGTESFRSPPLWPGAALHTVQLRFREGAERVLNIGIPCRET